MKLEALHHITMITGDAQRTVEFYSELLGLRLVKTTVNFDAPEAYHLYFGDETGAPGSILTWFEFAGAPRGRPAAGMIHTILLGVGSTDALDFWADRLRSGGHTSQRTDTTLRFADHDGLSLELVVADPANPPLTAVRPQVAPEHAIVGAQGARAYATDPSATAHFLSAGLGFTSQGDGRYRLVGEHRQFSWDYDAPPEHRGRQGAGTVHHIAWACRDDEHTDWQRRARAAGAAVTEVRDRDYFKSIYFREPCGVLFEIATMSPGFAVDEDPDHLGEALKLPPMHEHLRAELIRTLTPIVNPRASRAGFPRA